MIFYNESPQKVLDELSVDEEKGLTEQQAEPVPPQNVTDPGVGAVYEAQEAGSVEQPERQEADTSRPCTASSTWRRVIFSAGQHRR